MDFDNSLNMKHFCTFFNVNEQFLKVEGQFGDNDH